MTTYDSAAPTGTTTTATRGRWASAGLWTLQILLAASFAFSGVNKLVGEPTTVAGFQKIGMGDWFMALIGVLEVAGAAGLLIPRLSGLAGLALTGLLVGAVVTQIVVFDGELVYVPAVIGVFTALVAWGRRGRTTQLLESLTGSRSA